MLFLLVVGVLGLTACNVETNVVVESDGTFTAKQTVYTTVEDMQLLSTAYKAGWLTEEIEVTDQEAIDKILSIKTDDEFEKILKETGSNYDYITVDGKKYFYEPTQIMDSTDSLKNDPNCIVTADTFELKVDLEGENELFNSSNNPIEDEQFVKYMLESITSTVKVTMPNEILFTNGELSEDRKTVSFKTGITGKSTTFYAYCSGSDGIIKLNTKEGGYTNKDVVKVQTPDKLEQLIVNGEKLETGKQIELEEDGIYNIDIVTDCAEKSVVVVKDTKAPKVTGVKNNKTYSKKVTIKYSDDVSGIKSAKLNGKRIKSGKKVKKAGDYTLVVTDKAGNKTTVKFSIK